MSKDSRPWAYDHCVCGADKLKNSSTCMACHTQNRRKGKKSGAPLKKIYLLMNL